MFKDENTQQTRTRRTFLQIDKEHQQQWKKLTTNTTHGEEIFTDLPINS